MLPPDIGPDLATALRPMDEAPRNATQILVVCHPDLVERTGREDLSQLEARACVVHHLGDLKPDDFDMGWYYAPGYSGLSTDWFVGWVYLHEAVASVSRIRDDMLRAFLNRSDV